jgi:hypothetical protein
MAALPLSPLQDELTEKELLSFKPPVLVELLLDIRKDRADV